LLEDFRVGSIGIAWDPGNEVLIIEAYAIVDQVEHPDDPVEPDSPAVAGADRSIGAGAGAAGAGDPDVEGDDHPDDDDAVDESGDVLRVRLSPAAARAFAKRALAVVGAGRPPCPFCGLPLDPSGHLCPRQNGYRRR
jgi:hypothetical protein